MYILHILHIFAVVYYNNLRIYIFRLFMFTKHKLIPFLIIEGVVNMCTSFINQIKKSQVNKDQDLLKLIEKFNPIISKYAYLLKYEDAKNDMQYDFMLIILKLNMDIFIKSEDKHLLAYIKKATYHSYIKRSMDADKTKKSIPISNLSEEQHLVIDYLSCEKDDYEVLLLSDLKKHLT